jgi:hypothetical protein
MGAICLQEHSDKLQILVNDALEKGAEIVVRGSFGHLGEGAVDQFYPPTVLVNVDHTMKLMQEEVAGLPFFTQFHIGHNILTWKENFVLRGFFENHK